ncbi:MAG: glycoside hydrolase family 9 protein [Ruminococcus sp.]|nr:glycoside hydrolase family 9 protein [Ruminococcus sp.]
MKSKLKKVIESLIASVTLVSITMPVCTANAADNIITNSTFDSGTTDWGIYKESGGKGTLSTENGKLALTVTDLGKVNYAVQMFYDIVPLYQNGVYRLSFEISSTTDRFVEAMIQQNGGTYQAYTWKGIDVTSEPQTIDYEFTMEAETDIMAKFAFNCGTQGEDLPEHKIYLDNVVLELIDDSKVDYSSFKPYESPIITNQIGYKANDRKTAVIRNVPPTDSVKTCSVINADTKETVYSGTLSNGTENSSAGEFDYTFDFSEVTESGKYYIQCDEIADCSYTFEISENPYGNLLNDSVKMLYLQRCGSKVEDETFGHEACHNTKALIYGTNETIDVTGGWHDAGDYGRYIVPAAKAVADLLYAYETAPRLYGDNIGIPESGNGIPDVLDEVRYELEWMLKMQAPSGGVYHKVTCETFPGYVMPEKETAQLIVTPVSTTATANFCASMAMAYEFYRDIDSDFAQKCLSSAEKAWNFLESNPNFIFEDPEDITTGSYEDTNDTDERYWASAQMYRATGNQKYLTALENITAKKGLDWSTVGDYGNIAILTMKDIDKNSSVYKNAKDIVISQADKFAKITNSSPYGVAVNNFNWGSNMTVANAGIILGTAYQITSDEAYLETAKDNLNYLLGKNPNGVCYVTGYGTVSPQNPHHRPSMSKGTAMKGMLVGGVNSNLEDSAAKAYLRNEPLAKRYVDHSESYSTNEITIYWNSPLTYLLSLTDSDSEPVTPPVTDPTTPTNPTTDSTLKGDANCDGKVDIADVVTVASYVGNSSENMISEQGIKNGDVHNSGNGLNANDSLMIQQYLAGVIKDLSSSSSSGSSIPDYGTPMNSSATAVADFTKGETPLFIASDGWGNGSCFDCGWYKENTSFKDNVLNLTIDKDSSGKYNYSGAEYRTNDFYHYGYYETSMQAIKNDGVVSSFFTYTGPSDNNPWDEIDIEILGKDTTKVQFNYYTNGQGNHEYMYDLGFDASEGYHTYGFDWQPDKITWYVDGKAVYSATSNIPTTPGKIMMNVWPGTGVDEWLNPFDGTTPLTARYQWVTYNKN